MFVTNYLASSGNLVAEAKINYKLDARASASVNVLGDALACDASLYFRCIVNASSYRTVEGYFFPVKLANHAKAALAVSAIDNTPIRMLPIPVSYTHLTLPTKA